jgi:fatty-acyl-CoA synthase
LADSGASVDQALFREHLEQNGFARWQLPERFELIDEIPRTTVGKFDKKVLRARFAR